VLQHEYIDAQELAERLQVTLATLRQRVQAELWKRTPRPAGKAGKSLYWSRAEVERWFASEPRRLGPLRGVAGNSD
jgi:predicted DNA-binding transcriptional regulator AlpA